MKIIATLGALLLTATAASALPYGYGDDTFTSKSGYIVHVSHAGDRTLLTGRHPVTGVNFDLQVAPSGMTTGTWGGKPFARLVALHGRSKAAPEQIASSAR